MADKKTVAPFDLNDPRPIWEQGRASLPPPKTPFRADYHGLASHILHAVGADLKRTDEVAHVIYAAVEHGSSPDDVPAAGGNTEIERLRLNFQDVVKTKRRTEERFKVALAALQKIYDESTDDGVSEIAGKAFDEATREWPRSEDRSPAANAWQPIETAPKDGTSILVTDARVKEWTQVAWWDDEAKTDWKWAHSDADGLWHKDSFTHWMPVPIAPAFPSTEGDRHD